MNGGDKGWARPFHFSRFTSHGFIPRSGTLWVSRNCGRTFVPSYLRMLLVEPFAMSQTGEIELFEQRPASKILTESDTGNAPRIALRAVRLDGPLLESREQLQELAEHAHDAHHRWVSSPAVGWDPQTIPTIGGGGSAFNAS